MTEEKPDEDDLTDFEIINVKVGKKIMNWVEEQIEEERFASKAHAVRICLKHVMTDHPHNFGN